MNAIPPRSSYRLTYLVLAVGVTGFAALQSLVAPVLPLFQTNLHTDQDTVTWMLTAYLLSASVCTPILGRIGDIVGKSRVLVLILVTVTLGSVLAAIADSISVMIVARVIQGVGGGIVPLAFGIIRDEFPREKVGRAVGVMASLIALGSGVALVLAGPIVNDLDYHWLFWLPGAVMGLTAIGTYFFLPRTATRSPGSISFAPALLLSGWLVALLIALSEAPSWGWASVRVLGLLAAAVILSIAWVAVELRTSRPVVDMKMMRIRGVWTANLVALMFGAGMYTCFFFAPTLLQTPSSAGYGFSASITTSGLYLLPLTIAMFGAGTVSGWLSTRFGSKPTLVLGSAITFGGFVVLTVAYEHAAPFEVAMVLIGTGIGLAFAAMANLIVDAVPSHQTGVASGMNANIRTIGGSIGAAAMASIVTAHLMPSGLPRQSGYTHGFVLLAATALLAALASLLVPKITTVRDEHQREQAALIHPQAALVAAGTIVGDDPE